MKKGDTVKVVRFGGVYHGDTGTVEWIEGTKVFVNFHPSCAEMDRDQLEVIESA